MEQSKDVENEGCRMTREEALTIVAVLAQASPEFVGYYIALFRENKGWTEEQFMGWMGMTQEDLLRVKMAKRPNCLAEVEGLAVLGGTGVKWSEVLMAKKGRSE